MKYKVGDRVRVRSDLVPNTDYGSTVFAYPMMKYVGEEFTVCEAWDDTEPSYHLEGCKSDSGYQWFWTDEMLEDPFAVPIKDIDIGSLAGILLMI